MAGGMTDHRASYILERGLWRATCRACGWQVSDEQRRRACAMFRSHITAQRERVIDLRVIEATTTADAGAVASL